MVEAQEMTERLLDANEGAAWLGVPVSWVRESTRSGLALRAFGDGRVAGIVQAAGAERQPEAVFVKCAPT